MSERPPDAAGAAPDGAGTPALVEETSIIDLRPGDEATVGRMVGGSAGRLGRLSAYGLAPGARVRLVQKRPVIVIEVGGTRLALDSEVAATLRIVRGEPR